MRREDGEGVATTRKRPWFWFQRPVSGDNLAAVLDVALYRGEPEDRRELGELDLGSFLRHFIEIPHDLAEAGTKGALRIEVNWHHPWELSVYAYLTGSKPFLVGVPHE